ncbi:MAG: N-acetyl-gamma-glutamyl-phosphate reductase [Solirubrobacterales bacterium]|nr:N-acetyl-gamma-glutamyl-phosphate reductase [Solirubrobacterales bacterium]
MSSVASRVLVAGASGYAGALAARLVQRHPRLELAAVTSRSDVGKPLRALYPHHRVDAVLEELDVDGAHGEVDAAIVAYPHGAAAPAVAALHARGVKVIDLSADFRIRDLATYEDWYVPHTAPELLPSAVYGLPERYRDALRESTLVANPGCFPTAAVLALAPLAPYLTDVVIDAKTGVSGAGRAATDTTHFVSVDENVKPYKVGAHRHTPEIEQELEAAGGPAGMAISFTPHLLPLDQGELLSCYLRMADGAPPAVELLSAAYAAEPFVELVDGPPGVRDVRETNLCALHVVEDARTGRTMVFAAIDNLWKGTSSQAIQNLNLMLGFPEDEGIA